MNSRPRAFVLVGPTASGKSAVAQLLAGQLGTAVVSADSMNVYRGMDIGTAKPSAAERARTAVWGVDLADPSEPFSVARWLAAVRPAFLPPSPVPVVAGGTGLYVKSLLQGLDDFPAADESLRAQTAGLPLAELQERARRLDPAGYAALADCANPRRLIRLIEQGGRSRTQWAGPPPEVLGLHWERDALHRRIAQRVEAMYAGGLLEEARGLAGLELSSTARHAIGYAEAFAVLRGELDIGAAQERTAARTRQLAKRQMTWFRHQLRVEWVDAGSFPDAGALAAHIAALWRERGPVPAEGAA